MIRPMSEANQEFVRRALATGALRVDLHTGAVYNRDDRYRDGTQYNRCVLNDPKGYIQVMVRDPETGRYHSLRAHTVVYIAAHGEIPPGHVVTHRDNNRENNRPSNLQALSVADAWKKTRRRAAQLASLPRATVLRARELSRQFPCKTVARMLHISEKSVRNALGERPYIAGAEQAVDPEHVFVLPPRGVYPAVTRERMEEILACRAAAGKPADARLPEMIAMRTDGATYQEIADHFDGLSRERVRQLLEKAVRYIRDAEGHGYEC
jgi:hypothetical protein